MSSTTIPDSVTTIGDYAFLIDDDVQPLAEDETTEELLNITLPASLTYLGVGAFANRSNIKSICSYFY